MQHRVTERCGQDPVHHAEPAIAHDYQVGIRRVAEDRPGGLLRHGLHAQPDTGVVTAQAGQLFPEDRRRHGPRGTA